jgi:hypothetical protein
VCRSEDDQNRQILLDVVEPVLDLFGHKDGRASLDREMLVSDLHLGLAGDDVVDLVLDVRRLAIHAASREQVQPRAHGGHLEELVVRSAGRRMPGQRLRK